MTTKRAIFLCAACFALLSVSAYAENYKLTFKTNLDSQFGCRLTPEEFKAIEAKIEGIFPETVEEVVAFLGDEKLREEFRETTVVLFDSPLDHEGYWGAVRFNWRGNTYHQVFLHVEPFLMENAPLKAVMVHEMIHSAMKLHHDIYEVIDIPRYVREGMAYYGMGMNEAFIHAYINMKPLPDNIEKVMTPGDEHIFLRNRMFFSCFEKNYGKEKTKEAINRIHRGKDWKKSLESAAGKEISDIKKDCDVCIRGHLAKYFDADPPIRHAAQHSKDEDYESAVTDLKKYLDENPQTPLRDLATWKLAVALEKAKKFDEAMRYFEDFRANKYGLTFYYEDAALHVVKVLTATGKCEEAVQKRKEFFRLYPSFRREWLKELDDDFKENCEKKALGDASPTPAAE